jgi:nucleoside triphosphate diphosphatase
MSETGDRFQRAVDIMARLRGPDGCPWDREQSFDTIKPYTLEEAYEVLEAIDKRDWDELPGELGDLLLQVLFYAQMASEERRFDINDVLERLANKLIGRHPHVFGDIEAKTSADVLRNWEALKAQENAKKEKAKNEATPSSGRPESVLAGVSTAVPSLLEAFKLSSRAAHIGFEWPDLNGLFAQLSEETEELRREVDKLPQPVHPPGRGVANSQGGPRVSGKLRERLEDEVGDLLFVLVNVARYLTLDPESALRRTNRKFKRRFQWMEEKLQSEGRDIRSSSFETMETLWQAAKRDEQEAECGVPHND